MELTGSMHAGQSSRREQYPLVSHLEWFNLSRQVPDHNHIYLYIYI